MPIGIQTKPKNHPKQTKNQMILTVTILTIISITKAECGIGCLECDLTTKTCKLCDFLNMYSLDAETRSCKKEDVSKTNCALLDIDYKCVKCNTDHYYKENEKVCVPLDPDTKVDHCIEHALPNECLVCENNFVMLNKICLELTKTISNCEVYESAVHCKICKEGYLPSLDKFKCQKLPTISFCSSFSHVDCTKCKDKFVKEPTLSLYTQQSWNSTPESKKSMQDFLFASLDEKNTNKVQEIYGARCDSARVNDCLEFISPRECKTCSQGFLIDRKESKCTSFPETPIADCVQYTSGDVCSQCKSPTYLDPRDPKKCQSSDEITHCKVYDPNGPNCILCQEEYYIDGKECVKRVASLSLAGCEEKDPNGDKCKTCVSDFVLLESGTCIQALNNCMTHKRPVLSAETLECEKCLPTHYFREKQCFKGPDPNCILFNHDTPKCLTCADGYYLHFVNADENLCLKHTKSPSACKTLSNTVQNKCILCKNDFLTFQNQKICKEVETKIDKCLIYESKTECRKCENFYKPPNCDPIPANLNCFQVQVSDPTKCDVCKDGYFKNNYPYLGVCTSPYETQNMGCEAFDLPPSSERMICEHCKTGFLPVIFDGDNDFICDDERNYSNLDSNCLAYEYDKANSTQTCVLCKPEFVLGSDDSCKAACEANEVLVKVTVQKSADNPFYKVLIKNKCQTVAALPNCEIAVPSLDHSDMDDPELVCVKCKSTFSEVIPVHTGNKILTHNWDQSAQNFILHQRNPQIICENITNPKLLGTIDSADCEKYYKVHTDKYSCAKCKFGKTGKVVEVVGHNLSFTKFFAMEKCNESVKNCLNSESDSRGLTFGKLLNDSVLNISFESIATCFKCFGSDSKIPFINYYWVPAQKYILLKNYNISKTILTNDITDFSSGPEVPDGLATTCLDYKLASDFGAIAENAPNFIENCAIGGFNLMGSTKDSLNTNGYAVCLACKAGFEPEFITGSFVIKNCKSYSSCASSPIMNQCAICDENKIFDIATNQCLLQNVYDKNCIFGSNTECNVCVSGYSVNLDGTCETINQPQCESGYMMPAGGLKTTNLDYFLTRIEHFFMGGGAESSGCSKCVEKYIALSKAPKISTHCLESSYLTTDKLPAGTKFIPDCLNLKYNYATSSIVCGVCKSGFMPSYDRKRCVNQAPFCLMASQSGDGVCFKCKDGYSVTDGKCSKHQIPNCQEFYSDSLKVFCKTCSPGYYKDLLDKECTKGDIPNCDQYRVTDPIHCIKCMEGYHLFRNNMGRTICLDATHLNCKVWDDDVKYSCSLCKDGYYPGPVEDGDPSTTCVGGNFKIDNCTNLDEDFACSFCDTGYYLSPSRDKCIELTTPLENCKTPYPDRAECQICEDGYYLRVEVGRCFPYPAGISNCIEYLDTENCKSCTQGFYLVENQCKAVTEIIPFCKDYFSNTTCKLCAEGYSLNPNATSSLDLCKKIEALNCVTASDIYSCATCQSEFGLFQQGKLLNCQKMPFKADCDQQDINDPYDCIKCADGKYLDKGECKTISTPIANCDIQLNDTICSQCAESFLLKSDRSECIAMSSFSIIKTDEQCVEYNQDPRSFSCGTCMPGYKLSLGGSCVAIFNEGSVTEDDGGSSEVGCAFYTDYTFKVCQICRSGYNMDDNAKCLVNTQIGLGDGNSDDSGSGDGSTDGKSISVLFTNLIFAFIFLILY